MARKTNAALALVLSAALAFGTLPAPALAEMAEEAMGMEPVAATKSANGLAANPAPAPAQDGVPAESQMGEEPIAPQAETSPTNDPAADPVPDPAANANLAADLTAQAADPAPVQPEATDLANQSLIASGTWGTCPWELDNGVLTIFPGTGADTTKESEITPGSTYTESPWYDIHLSVFEVRMVERNGEKVKLPQNSGNLFGYLQKAETIDLSGADTSNVKDMENMFYECRNLDSLDLSGFETSNVTDMSNMFGYCDDLTSLDLSDLETSNVTDMSNMFVSCSGLVSLNLSGWTTSNVTNMRKMFEYCYNLTTLDLSGWNTSNVTSMYEMFHDCTALTSLDISGWDTSKVASLSSGDMFSNCTALARLVVGAGFTLHSAVPAYTVNGVDGWYSETRQSLLTHDQFVASDNIGIADTYVKRPVDGDTDISGATVTLPATSFMYDGIAKTPVPTVKLGDTTLTEGKDYGVTYSDNLHIGTATVKIQGWGEYKGICTANFQITGDLSAARVARIADQTYSDSECTPDLTVTLDGRTLDAKTDYDVSYTNNVNAGTATATITAKGEYSGTKVVEFRIAPKPVEDPVTATGLVYNGTEQTGVSAGEGYTLSGDVSCKDAGVHTATATLDANYVWADGTTDPKNLSWFIDPKPITVSGVKTTKPYGTPDPELATIEGLEGEDTISYLAYRTPGEALGVYDIGLYGPKEQGNYSVTYASGQLTIIQADISDAEVDPIECQVYTSSAITPKPVVRMGETTLTEGTDYDLSYENNVETGIDTAIVKITGKENYKGTKQVKFSISSNNIANQDLSLDREVFPVSAVPAEPTVSVREADSDKALVEGVDFTVSYRNNGQVGQAKAVVVGKDAWAGTVELPFEIVERVDISDQRSGISFGLEADSFVYRDSPVEPKVKSLSPVAQGMSEGVDYTLSYENNEGPGTAKVIIEGQGSYTGTVSMEFQIVKNFSDVPVGAWYEGMVYRAVGLGLLGGYSGEKAGLFGPDDNITRGQVAVILWNMAKKPAAGTGAKPFPDVDSKAYYCNAVRWASSAGVVSGYKDGTFGPNDNVTREQLAVMLANYSAKVAGKPASGSASDFASMADGAKVASWAVPAVGWCFKSKILSGSNGNVNPQGNATRAEAAKMVVYLHDLVG